MKKYIRVSVLSLSLALAFGILPVSQAVAKCKLHQKCCEMKCKKDEACKTKCAEENKTEKTKETKEKK